MRRCGVYLVNAIQLQIANIVVNLDTKYSVAGAFLIIYMSELQKQMFFFREILNQT